MSFPNDKPPLAMTPKQVSQHYPALTEGFLEKLRMRGNGPAYSKPSRSRVIYRPEDISAWLDASRVNSTSESLA